MTDNLIEGKALKLEPGGIYVIEADSYGRNPLSQVQATNLRTALNREEDRLGVKFMVLFGGCTIAREKSDAA